MARSRRSSSNIHSTHDHVKAFDIADRSLRGEFVHPGDAIGVIPEKLAVPDVEFKHLTKDTGTGDSSKGNLNQHKGIGETPGHPKATHEKTPVDFSRAGAEAFREQHGTSEDEEWLA